MQTLWQDIRYGLRGHLEPSRICVSGDPDAGARHRRGDHHLQRHPERPAGSVSLHRRPPGRRHPDPRPEHPPVPAAGAHFRSPEFLDYQEQNHVFEEVIGGTGEDVLLSTAEGTEQSTRRPRHRQHVHVPGRSAGARARHSRRPTPAPGAPPVFVMAYKMWVKHYNRDPGILGRTFVLNGVPTTLVGIMPPRFTKLAADLWRPVRLDRGDPGDRADGTSCSRRG